MTSTILILPNTTVGNEDKLTIAYNCAAWILKGLIMVAFLIGHIEEFCP